MLPVLSRFFASSNAITLRSPKVALALGIYDDSGERVIDFFGVPIVFPDWDAEIEHEIRACVSPMGLTDEGKADMARSLIVAYLEDKDDIRNRPFRNQREALFYVSAHAQKVSRARGIVCER